MANLIIGYGTQGKKRFKYINRNKKKTYIYDKFSNFSSPNFIKDLDEINISDISHAYICLPEDEKKKYLKYLIDKKVNVLIEKPISLKNNEIKDILKNINSTSYTAYNHRFEPHIVNIKKFLQKKTIGEIYNVKIYYGNGTAKLWHNSWRSKEKFSILHDLGSHVLDIVLFLFERLPNRYSLNIAKKNELPCYDFMQFTSRDTVSLSASLSIINWQNYFYLDILGSKGSIHLNGLCKWGPSVLKINKRVLPSGFPIQKINKIKMKDPTWAIEEKYFRKISKNKFNNLNNDILINKSIENIKC